jgi:hypothetical protein
VRDLQLVIFDCDGVLVDSEVISNNVLARSLTEQGLPTTLAQSRRDYQGLLLAEIDSRAQAKLGRPLAEDWLERYERERAAVFRRELRAVPGVAEAVRQIKAASSGIVIPGCPRTSDSASVARLPLPLGRPPRRAFLGTAALDSGTRRCLLEISYATERLALHLFASLPADDFFDWLVFVWFESEVTGRGRTGGG